MIRFWSKADVKDKDSCWIWKGSKNRGGYGTFWFRGRLHIASRVSWMIAYGDIPDGMLVCHRCDIPLCVNPDHLWLGTDMDNTIDKLSKRRQTNRRGADHGMAKLSEDEVLQIRELMKHGASGKKLAKEYGVSDTLIYYIHHRKLWKSI